MSYIENESKYIFKNPPEEQFPFVYFKRNQFAYNCLRILHLLFSLILLLIQCAQLFIYYCEYRNNKYDPVKLRLIFNLFEAIFVALSFATNVTFFIVSINYNLHRLMVISIIAVSLAKNGLYMCSF